MMRVLGRRQFNLSLAEVWFRPLAWALIPEPGNTPQFGEDLVTLEGWPDVTEWLCYSTDRTSVDLRNIVRAFPTVVHPRTDPRQRDSWVEMLSDEAPLLEGVIPR